MASQPPDTGRDRNQVRPLRSTVSSVRGKANRHRSTGVFGSHFVLDCGGSRKQAARFQDLLQQPSHPYLNGRANTESACVTTNRKSPFVSMATSLSILISDTSGCVIFRRLSIAPLSGQPWEDVQLNHLLLAFLVAARFADPIRFTPTVSIRQRQDYAAFAGAGGSVSRSSQTTPNNTRAGARTERPRQEEKLDEHLASCFSRKATRFFPLCILR